MRLLLSLPLLHLGRCQNVSTTAPLSTTTGPPRDYCPDGFCIDSRVVGSVSSPQCIYPTPEELGKCWDDYCVDEAQHLNTSVQGAYCKDWQNPAGRVCFPLSNLTCYCKELRQIAPIVSSPGQQPPGWVSVDCVYPSTSPPPPSPSTSTGRPDPPSPGGDANRIGVGSIASLLVAALYLYV
ncbi:hypothetical protein FOZ60_003849 [Perkinsus olseni]|uniref:Uncharacterized protein n=1 Tax=Perkinsus olseni TaxID=32597 RepID=A0A7J6NUD9_PEROL|nr:hypothetical protein FOZ60_003849 [Perkinsus olseni]